MSLRNVIITENLFFGQETLLLHHPQLQPLELETVDVVVKAQLLELSKGFRVEESLGFASVPGGFLLHVVGGHARMCSRSMPAQLHTRIEHRIAESTLELACLRLSGLHFLLADGFALLSHLLQVRVRLQLRGVFLRGVLGRIRG